MVLIHSAVEPIIYPLIAVLLSKVSVSPLHIQLVLASEHVKRLLLPALVRNAVMMVSYVVVREVTLQMAVSAHVPVLKVRLALELGGARWLSPQVTS